MFLATPKIVFGRLFLDSEVDHGEEIISDLLQEAISDGSDVSIENGREQTLSGLEHFD
jgi:hypothetical protein